MTDPKSRYAALEPETRTDARGRTIRVLPPAPPSDDGILGWHRRKEGVRLDHLAARYLDDPAGFWRICDANDAILPDAIAETLEVAIPGRRRR